jgi:hypothetical protein
VTIPADYCDLVGAPHYAHVATINADGSPQSTAGWVLRDGDDVLYTKVQHTSGFDGRSWRKPQ